MKKLLMLVVFVLSLACLTGCADVKYRRIYSSTGTIIDEVNVSLEKSTFSSSDVESLYGTIKADFDTYSNLVNAWIKNQFSCMYVEEASVEEFIRSGISTKITNISSDKDKYYFSFLTEFKSIEHFVYFYGLNTPEVIERFALDNFEGVEGFSTDIGPFMEEYINNEYQVDTSKLFTRDYIFGSDNVYENFKIIQRNEDMSFIDYYCSRINSLTNNAYTESEILENINITQYFVTDDKRFDANADSKYIDSEIGYYVYEWNLNDNPDRNIEISRARPEPVWWYVGAFVVALVYVLIMFIIWNVKKKKELIKNGEGNNERL